ncbi:MAG: putative glycosyltransferase [Bacteroidota bacterium]
MILEFCTNLAKKPVALQTTHANMRILILHNLLWSQYKSVVFEKIAQTCTPKDEVLVVQTAITEKGREDLVDFDVANYAYQFPVRLLNRIPLQQVSPWKTMWEWIRIILDFRPDVINLTGYSEVGTFPVLLLCKCLGIKTIMTVESIENLSARGNALANSLKTIYKRFLIQLCDGFFSYGLNTNKFLFQSGVGKRQILSYLNAFDKVAFHASLPKQPDSPHAKPYLLFVGRLSPEKNLPALFDLMKHLSIDLLVVGNGPQYDELTQKKQQESIENIHLLGTVAWANLANLYQHATALMLVSTAETWGMVANEAQELHKPVICTEACGCANDLVIDGKNGLVLSDITSPKNISKIQQFLDNFPKNQADIEAFSERNSQIFSVEKLATEMLEGFHKICKA